MPSPMHHQVHSEAMLVMLHPPGPTLGRRFPLSKAEHVIGRMTDLDIAVDADSVSRRHARVFRDGDTWCVEDLKSTNGSFVNDERVDRRTLNDGDLLRCGEAIFKFLSGSNVEAAYHEEIYRLTILDGMTGVHNVRFFKEFLERELARAHRHRVALALVMFDVDHFKVINDTHGHLAGDAVLKEICRRLKPRIRREDLLARYGGEEFACVLPDTSKSGAVAFAEALRRLIERDPFVHEDKEISATISLGVSMYEPEPGSGEPPLDAEELIRRSDEKLYAAKHAGRNRVFA
jgi:diguanylate cyclase (GGDEF)-like protein